MERLAKAMMESYILPLAMITFVGVPRCSGCDSAIAPHMVWDRAIAAKGGHKRIASVESILVSKTLKASFPWFGRSKGRYETLLVLPDRAWYYSDPRDSIFGPGLRVVDLGDDYAQEFRGSPLARSRPNEGDRVDFAVATAQMFLETTWQKPLIRSASLRHRIGGSYWCVLTELADRPFEFWFDERTYLLTRLVVTTSTKFGPFVEEYRLGHYAEVGGLQLPHEIVSEGPGRARAKWELVYQLNVDYEPDIFNGHASLSDGPTGWRRRP